MTVETSKMAMLNLLAEQPETGLMVRVGGAVCIPGREQELAAEVSRDNGGRYVQLWSSVKCLASAGRPAV